MLVGGERIVRQMTEDELFKSIDYQNAFFEEVELVLTRFKRFKEIQFSNTVDSAAYLDLLLVHVRALFCDGQKGGEYTASKFFSRMGRTDLAQKIDTYFDQPLNDWMTYEDGQPLLRRTAIKMVVDKRIVHFDERSLDWKATTDYLAKYLVLRELEGMLLEMVKAIQDWQRGLLKG